jgi:photosystem II stability/assembly factor-like uncharacterized protein
MTTIYLATNTGLAICAGEGTYWQAVGHVLQDQHVTAVMAREGVILAGTTKGVQRSDDGGKSWRAVNNGLSSRHIRWLAYHPAISDLEFAGTEPAGIFVSHDGAEHWQARPEVAALRDQHGWMLPYSPEAGCVRGFTFHGQRAYAAVEVGGVLRSDDGGETWALAAGSDGNPDLSGPPEPFVYPDIHDVAVHPSSPDLIFAVTGGGFYRSNDGGATWTLLYDCYCRAIWPDPNDAQHIIFGPADGVGRMGRIEETHDGGKSWRPASGSLKVPWPNTMAERLTLIGQDLFAVLDDGRLLVAPLATLDWQFILPEVSDVNAMTAMHM